jgi:hypothetical protein
MGRRADLIQFYGILSSLEEILGGKRTLAECDGRIVWPSRGVYFFFEPGEVQSDTGVGPRVVRVGTHALKCNSGTSLWQRLSQHRGTTASGGGSHRGSIFRLLVGTAIKHRDALVEPRSWDVGSNQGAAARSLGLTREQVLIAEQPLETAVSEYIRRMPFLCFAIDDMAGPKSDRGVIERNAIALLSNYNKPEIDPPSTEWLGHHCDRERVRLSGLWNNRHVDEEYDSQFLTLIERCVERPPPPPQHV